MSTSDNPLLTASPLPLGFPDFDRIRDEHFLPAFEAAMAEHRREVDAIASLPDEPTFDNTVTALERSGATLRSVSAVFFVLTGSLATSTVREIEAEVAPLLAAHRDAIALDPHLFHRLDVLHEQRESLGLDEESLRLLERLHRDAVRAGARLDESDQERLRELNAELSTLSTRFGAALLADTNDSAVLVEDAAELAGLPESAVAAAARAAAERGHDGGYLLSLVLPTGQPVLADLSNRALRERVFRASVDRGARGNEHDTRATLLRMVRLRAVRARLLGYDTHASWVIENGTAGSVGAVMEMLSKLVPPATANAEREAADLSAEAGFAVEPWDRAYYAERVRRARYDVDLEALRPYLELDRVLHEGVFFAAGELYGLRFAERHDLPLYHPDVRVFSVSDSRGEEVGLYVADLYARDTKRGGAWMNSFVSQSHLLGTRPVVLNTLNVTKPPEGQPTLLRVDEAETLFHEFGHALHGLLSDVTFPTFAGTAVPRDFVEFPSQVNEMWLTDDTVLTRFARHHVTGEPIPRELVHRWQESRTFGEGFATTEYLAAALLDLAWHTLTPEDDVDDVLAFEDAALERAGVRVATAPPRYRSTYFNHVFSGGYSAGYYSYIWSEVLDADTVEWFRENGGLRAENGEAFRRALLSRGGSVDPMEAYRSFRGRDPELAPLLARRALD